MHTRRRCGRSHRAVGVTLAGPFDVWLVLAVPAVVALGRPIAIYYIDLVGGLATYDRYFSPRHLLETQQHPTIVRSLLTRHADPHLELLRQRAVLAAGAVGVSLVVAYVLATAWISLAPEDLKSYQRTSLFFFAELTVVGLYQLVVGNRRWIPRSVALVAMIVGALLFLLALTGAQLGSA